jgi:hypothetical protein
MNSRQRASLILLAIVAGFMGGFISNKCFTLRPAFAENESKPQEVVIAKEIKLIDDRGILRARLGFNHNLRLTEFILYSPLDDPLHAPSINLSTGNMGGFLRIEGASSHNVHAHRAILSAYESQATMSMGSSSIPEGNIELSTSDLSTDIVLRDYGYNRRVIIGNVDLANKKTGFHGKNPLSSIVLLNEKEDFLWAAP